MPTEEIFTLSEEDQAFMDALIEALDDERKARAEHAAEIAECCGGNDPWCGHFKDAK